MNIFEIWQARRFGMAMGKPDGSAPTYLMLGDEFNAPLDMIRVVDPADIRFVEGENDALDRFEIDAPATFQPAWPEGVEVMIAMAVITDGKTQLRHDFPHPIVVNSANPLSFDGPMTFPVVWKN